MLCVSRLLSGHSRGCCGVKVARWLSYPLSLHITLMRFPFLFERIHEGLTTVIRAEGVGNRWWFSKSSYFTRGVLLPILVCVALPLDYGE